MDLRSGASPIGCCSSSFRVRFTGATTKREAVVTALRDFNRRKRIAALTKHFGTSDTFMTYADLLKRRRAE